MPIEVFPDSLVVALASDKATVKANFLSADSFTITFIVVGVKLFDKDTTINKTCQ